MTILEKKKNASEGIGRPIFIEKYLQKSKGNAVRLLVAEFNL